MTGRPVRTKVAVAAITVGIAVLLAGPMNTFGVGVPGPSTVHGVVETTQQTAATTVTNVESTVQSTVQATTQAAPPQPAVAPQTQTSAPVATKQVTTRVAAPAKKHVAAVSRPRTQGKQAAPPVRLAPKAGGATVAEPVRRAAAKHARTHRVAAPAATTKSRTADAPSGCGLPSLALLPGGAQLDALLAVVCDAAGILDLPTRIGPAPSDTAVPAALGEVRGASARGTSDGPAVARSASRGAPTAAAGARQSAGTENGSSRPGRPAGGAVGRRGGLAYVGATPAAHTMPASGAGADAASASSHHHHTFFSGQSRGAEVLLAIIFASLSILGGIVLWRLAVRFVIPRFA